MNSHTSLFKQIAICSLLFISTTSFFSQATIVQFETTLGNFEVNLYDESTPKTVANFLTYLNAGDYSNAVFHRTESGFVLQGGGFKYNDNWPLDEVNVNAPVENEPVFSNRRGTIAMAKLGGAPDSATNQWFFNLADNSANLDGQNEGFTVFGEVTGDGMAFVDQISNIQAYNFGGALTSIPLQNFDVANTPNGDNLMIITSIQIIDATVNTAAGLNPPRNTTPPPSAPTSSSGGGSMGILFLLIAAVFNRRSRR
jgi:peptidyl-prolyl cis-trans isomerase A (cyclophilin A)